MAELRISSLTSGFVLYFETPEPRINAYALASALVNLANAAKIAGRTINSAVDIEVVVEALESGSFKARVSAIVRQAGLFVKDVAVPTILLGVLTNYIYDHTLAKKAPIEVTVNTDEVIITSGEDRVIVPREVHDATQQAAANPEFVKAMDRMMGAVASDERVTGFGLTPTLDSPPPQIMLPREALEVRDSELESEAKTRVVEEDCDLYIVKAILERSTRKWQFKWHGININAAIKDQSFYDDFAGHNFAIAPGDEFQAKLAIHQKRDDFSGIYTNTKYEVIQVYRHVPHVKPGRLNLK